MADRACEARGKITDFDLWRQYGDGDAGASDGKAVSDRSASVEDIESNSRGRIVNMS